MAKIGSWELNFKNSSNSDKMYWSPMTKEILEVPDDYNPSLSGGLEFYTPHSKAIIERAIENLIHDNQEFDLELRIITNKGNEKWIRTIGKGEFENDKCIKIYGSYQDIHQRKMTEVKLAETNKKLQSTLESIQDGFFALDHDWTVTYWNKEAKELMQTKREDILGKNLWDVFSEAIPLKFYEEYHRAVNEQKYVHFEDYFPPMDKWFEVSCYPSEEGLTVYFKDISDRKAAESELTKYQEIIENSQDGIAMASNKGEAIYMNPGFSKMLGYTAEQLQSKGGPMAVYADKKLASDVFESLLSGKNWKGDIELLDSKQSPISFYLSGGPIFNKKGELIAIYGIHTDISDRKKSEQKLQEAFEEKTNILESIGDGFFTVNKNWKVTYWNKQAEKLLQTPKEKILNKNLWKVFKNAVELPSYKFYHKALEEQVDVNFDDYYAPVDKWFEISAYPSENGLSVFFKDISIKKQAEELIRQSNERFEKATQATNDAIWDWDIENSKIYWGTGFNKLFGYDTLKDLPQNDLWSGNIHPKDIDNIYNSLIRTIKDKHAKNWQGDYRYKKSNGKYAHVTDRGIIIRNKKGKAIRLVGAMTDITERKKFENSLKRLNEALDTRAKELAISNAELEQFAYVASHDLQEPLRMVTRFLLQLEKKYSNELDDKAHQYIHYAVDGAKRMRQIILDLLEFSKVGKQYGHVEEIDLNQLVEDICLLNQKSIDEKKAKIKVNALPVIQNQRVPLHQIFQNLISNALKYSRADVPPEIEISAKKSKDCWTFKIKDNGIGIEAEYFERIFVIFQRLHEKKEYEGTGMGLAIVKKIIDNLGGKIWLESEMDSGTSFYFKIPKA